jgi:hypothetical protein
MSVFYPKIEVMHANHFTVAIWAFPVDDVDKRSRTKTSHKIGK